MCVSTPSAKTSSTFAILTLVMAATLVCGLSEQLHGQGFVPPLDHNGIGGSLEPIVHVDAQFEFVGDDPLGLQLTKKFLPGAESSTHVTEIVGPPSELRFEETVVNDTTQSWTDYHFAVDVPGSSTTPFGFSGYSLHETTPGTISISSIMEVIDVSVGNHSLWFFFDDPVDPHESFDFRSIVDFNPGANVATISQTPSVPEASSMSLALMGLIATGLRLRRRWPAPRTLDDC